MLWPSRPRLAAAPWIGMACVVGPLALWSIPGVFALVAIMGCCIFAVRAVDASTWGEGELSRLGYYAYLLDASRTPHRIELPSGANAGRRILLGVVLLGLFGGALTLGNHLELWRTLPYLDDLLILVEVGLLFTGVTSFIIGVVWLKGDAFDDPHHTSFVLSRSLADFWGRHWNRSFSGSLARAVFRPSGGRRHRVRGVLLTFFVSGLVHALPLVVAFVDRRQAIIGVAAAMLFFMLHGVGVLVEGALPRTVRRGWGGRGMLWGTWAATAPIYAPVMAVALGFHDRPFESLTFVRLLGL